jgi:hypothetical protein
MQTFTVLFGLVATAIVWYGSLLLANYRLARKSGFPVLLMPVDKSNIFWMIFSVPLRPVFMRILPTFAYEWLRPSIYGWEFRYRWQVQESVGPSFILAYPKQNELWTAEPEVCLAVLSRRKDFLQTDVSSGRFAPVKNSFPPLMGFGSVSGVFWTESPDGMNGDRRAGERTLTAAVEWR